MKRILASIVLVALLAPTLASADSFGIQPTLGQLLSRIAALEAILAHKTINCAVTATKSTVMAGEPFTIAWGSFGAEPSYSTDPQNAYSQNGEQQMLLNTPEARVYHFTFFGPNGTKVTCDQTIIVLPRQ